jgi:hypothetical protein
VLIELQADEQIRGEATYLVTVEETDSDEIKSVFSLKTQHGALAYFSIHTPEFPEGVAFWVERMLGNLKTFVGVWVPLRLLISTICIESQQDKHLLMLYVSQMGRISAAMLDPFKGVKDKTVVDLVSMAVSRLTPLQGSSPSITEDDTIRLRERAAAKTCGEGANGYPPMDCGGCMICTMIEAARIMVKFLDRPVCEGDVSTI